MPVLLGSHRFPSQKAAKAFLAELLDRIWCGPVEDPAVHDLLCELVARHHDAASKIGCGVRRFFIEPGRALFIERLDLTSEPVSVSKCLAGSTPTAASRLKVAMRYAVVPQVHAFRNAAAAACRQCGSGLQLEVDHVRPFCELRDAFLAQAPPAPREFADDEARRCTFRDEDAEWAAAWTRYHEEHAEFQMLCRMCNLAKSDKVV